MGGGVHWVVCRGGGAACHGPGLGRSGRWTGRQGEFLLASLPACQHGWETEALFLLLLLPQQAAHGACGGHCHGAVAGDGAVEGDDEARRPWRHLEAHA